MSAHRHRVPLECYTQQQLVQELKTSMCHGFIRTTGGEDLVIGDPCEIFIIHPMTGLMHPLDATVRSKDDQGRAICEIDNFSTELIEELCDFIGVDERELSELEPSPRNQEGAQGIVEAKGGGRSHIFEPLEQPLSVVEVLQRTAVVEVDARSTELKEAVLMPLAAIRLKRRTSDGQDVLQSPDTSIDGRRRTGESIARPDTETEASAMRLTDTNVDGMRRPDGTVDTIPEGEVVDGDTVVQTDIEERANPVSTQLRGPEADIVDFAISPEGAGPSLAEPSHRRRARSMETLDMLLPASDDDDDEGFDQDSVPIRQIPDLEPEDDGDTVVQSALERSRTSGEDELHVPDAESEDDDPFDEEMLDDGLFDDEALEEEREDDPLLIRTKLPAHTHERLRGLPLHEARKVARSGNLAERVALERIYGKSVWEPLLQNPNLTPPEVARIARMRNLPKPLIDTIVSRASWLTKSLVRRALLSNPRLSGRSLTAVLRALPKAELKLVPQQTSYPYKVREAANRILGQ